MLSNKNYKKSKIMLSKKEMKWHKNIQDSDKRKTFKNE
jgi:hypothetical protein